VAEFDRFAICAGGDDAGALDHMVVLRVLFPGEFACQRWGEDRRIPSSTAMGRLNMNLAAHRHTLEQTPGLARLVLNRQRQGRDYALAHPN
jgi:hypothetical protein